MLVSVVMPSYNHSKYVMAAAQSVLEQSYERLEFIVVDDGSKDNSVELLRGIDDPRLKLIVQENGGAHAAINRGLAAAQGDYLAIINSDDIFDPTRITKCLETLEREQSDFACTWIRVVDDAGAEKGIKQAWKNMRPSWSSDASDPVYWAGENFAVNILSSNFVSTTSNMLFSRQIYDEIGGMRNLRFAHDWDFMFRVVERYRCSVVPEPLMDYRIHGSNTISSNREWMLFEVMWTIAANLHRFHGDRLFGPDASPEDLMQEIRTFSNSVHVGGLDKQFWVLLSFINARRAAIGDAAETELLEDAQLRQVFIDAIDPA